MTTNQLTFTRFIAAMFIVFLHFAGSLFIIENDYIKVQREFLYLGVDYFYVLSGFVMMLAYGKNASVDKGKYWLNRVARIYPLHIFTLLLTVAISIIISLNYLEYYKFNVASFLLNFLLLQSWIPQHSLSWNVPSWSVSTEMFFYFVFPFIFPFLKNVNFKKITIYIVMFWAIMQLGMNLYYKSDYYGGYDTIERYFLFYNPFLHVSTFFIGLLCGKFYISNMERLRRNYDILIFILFFFTTILVYLLKDLFLHNGLLAIPFAVLILLVASNTGYLTKLFNNKKLVYLGEISFTLYLLQNPVYILLRKIFKVIGWSDYKYLYFFTGLIILIIASHFTYKYIEIPLRNLIRKINI